MTPLARSSLSHLLPHPWGYIIYGLLILLTLWFFAADRSGRLSLPGFLLLIAIIIIHTLIITLFLSPPG